MKRVCAWCKCELGDVDADPQFQRLISHGICNDCLKGLLDEMGKPFSEFLDSLGVPVMVVDGDLKIQTLNKQALALTGKDISEVRGYHAGVAIQCPFTTKQKMCGNTVHCKSCTINQAVTETFETGKSFEKVSAFPDNQMYDTVKTHNIRISTEKREDIVFLRIEENN